MKGKIEVENIELFCYHGCLPEETVIGSTYLVDITVTGDCTKAAKSDDLQHAIDYVLVNKIVEEEMKIPSKLLENVAYRILERCKKDISTLESAKVKISKISPPINGNVEKVSVTLSI